MFDRRQFIVLRMFEENSSLMNATWRNLIIRHSIDNMSMSIEIEINSTVIMITLHNMRERTIKLSEFYNIYSLTATTLNLKPE